MKCVLLFVFCFTLLVAFFSFNIQNVKNAWHAHSFITGEGPTRVYTIFL